MSAFQYCQWTVHNQPSSTAELELWDSEGAWKRTKQISKWGSFWSLPNNRWIQMDETMSFCVKENVEDGGSSRIRVQTAYHIPKSFLWQNNCPPGCNWLVGGFPCYIIVCEIEAHRVKILNRIALHCLIYSWDKAQIRDNPLDKIVLTVWCGRCQLAFKRKHTFAS